MIQDGGFTEKGWQGANIVQEFTGTKWNNNNNSLFVIRPLAHTVYNTHTTITVYNPFNDCYDRQNL
jgi:hypothetical protein